MSSTSARATRKGSRAFVADDLSSVLIGPDQPPPSHLTTDVPLPFRSGNATSRPPTILAAPTVNVAATTRGNSMTSRNWILRATGLATAAALTAVVTVATATGISTPTSRATVHIEAIDGCKQGDDGLAPDSNTPLGVPECQDY